MDAILAERRLDRGPAHAATREAEKQVPFLTTPERLVEAARLGDECPSHDGRERVDRVPEQKRGQQVALAPRPALSPKDARYDELATWKLSRDGG